MFSFFKKNKGPDSYCFSDAVEFYAYVQQQKEKGLGRDIIWKNSKKYNKLWKQAYEAYEKKEHRKAIQCCKKCMTMNPRSVNLRFEMAENHIELKEYDVARKILDEMIPDLFYDEEIARYYRRVGYILVEQKAYQCATACYLISKIFEDHPNVGLELRYVAACCGELPKIGGQEELDELLKVHNIPILRSKGFTKKALLEELKAKEKEADEKEQAASR